MPEEKWKYIPGFCNRYQISDFGRVRSFVNSVKELVVVPHFLKPYSGGPGYCQVILCDSSGKRCSRLVHRLVAQAFIPNPENKPEVNHIDGNPRNNAARNLEWATGRENIQHSIKVTKRRNWDRFMLPVRCIETRECFPSITAAAEWSSKSAARSFSAKSVARHIGDCCRKKKGRKTCCGLHWEFVDKQ